MTKKAGLKTFFLATAIILLLVFLNFEGWLEAPKSAVYGVSAPVLGFFKGAGDMFSSVSNFFLTLKDLEKENRQLRQENEKLISQVAQLNEVSLENDILRQRLFLNKESDFDLVMANVTGYNPQLGQIIMVDKGRADGLAAGMAAVTAGNFLAGQVAETGDHWAKIVLISDSSSRINASTQDSRIEGIIKGSHGLGLSLEMIPADKILIAGENVLTSGLNSALPKGILLGKIEQVNARENEIFQKAKVKSLADLSRLETVFVILK